MPFTPMQILGGFVTPAILLALLAGLAWRLTTDARWVFGPLIAIAFAVAYRVVEPKIGWPPSANVIYLLFYFAIIAGILTLADALVKPPIWLRILILLILWRLAVRFILVRQIPSSITGPDAEMWIDLSTLITFIWWITFERLADRAPGITTPLLLTALSGASAIVLATGWHIQSSAALAGVLALFSMTGVVLGAFSRRVLFSRGFAQMIVLILQLLLVHGYFYTDDDLTGSQQLLIGALLATPLLALIGDLPVFQKRRPITRLAIRLGPAIILLAFVCAATVRTYLRAEQSSAAMQDE